MIGLFFEVSPRSGHSDRYFELAAYLRPELEKNPGLLFIDRYKSVDRPDLVLSHSWWADEASLIAWREHSQHRAIQRAGREHHFKDYRIRIGRLCDGEDDGTGLRFLWAIYLDAKPLRSLGGELFESVYRDSKFLVLSDAPVAGLDSVTEQRRFAVIRDYTMYDRAEAPPGHPPLVRSQGPSG